VLAIKGGEKSMKGGTKCRFRNKDAKI